MRRYDEALVEIETARKLDPLSLIVNSIAGWVLHFAGRYDEAIERLKTTIDLDPRFVPAYGYLGKTFVAKRMFGEAIEQYQKVLRLSEGNPRYLADLGVATKSELCQESQFRYSARSSSSVQLRTTLT